MRDKHEGIWIGNKDLNQELDYIKSADEQSRIRPDETDQSAPEESTEYHANRRDFLKYMGFGLGAATIAAGCKTPVRKALPYVFKPDAIVPGIANYYASSYIDGGDYCSILVKTREGRRLKLKVMHSLRLARVVPRQELRHWYYLFMIHIVFKGQW
jgi:molybdopterin-containing oxidoreductase family iron-sulfur binding subunit